MFRDRETSRYSMPRFKVRVVGPAGTAHEIDPFA
jgi:hypothetical protein